MTVIHEGTDHKLHVYLIVIHDDQPPTEIMLPELIVIHDDQPPTEIMLPDEGEALVFEDES